MDNKTDYNLVVYLDHASVDLMDCNLVQNLVVWLDLVLDHY